MIYSKTEISKDGSIIPLLKSGKPMHSKYNPVKEAENQCSLLSHKDLFILLGLGSGFLLKEIRKRFPESMIVVYEFSENDIQFLFKNIDGLQSFVESNSIPCFPIDKITSTLPYYFKPAIVPSLQIVDNRNWIMEIGETARSVKDIFNETISSISSDYSVQCHFGKFFQHNILKNSRMLRQDHEMALDISKTAVIVAAGPSLDSKIRWLKENRQELIIISTDTASRTLSNKKIKCDYIVSIDGQLISQMHFAGENFHEKKLVFDLCTNPSLFRTALKAGAKILPTDNGHPLVSFIKTKFENPNLSLNLSSGSGTVTISACDFALKAGFSKILVIGADFGYKNGKPYCTATYLDQIYNCQSTKIFTNEQQYSKLMFRGEPLILQEEKSTTQLLQSYEKSFIHWASQNKLSLTKKDDVYFLESKAPVRTEIKTKRACFSWKTLLDDDCKLKADENLKTAMLPYMAYLRNKNEKTVKSDELLNIALKDLVRYTN